MSEDYDDKVDIYVNGHDVTVYVEMSIIPVCGKQCSICRKAASYRLVVSIIEIVDNGGGKEFNEKIRKKVTNVIKWIFQNGLLFCDSDHCRGAMAEHADQRLEYYDGLP